MRSDLARGKILARSFFGSGLPVLTYPTCLAGGSGRFFHEMPWNSNGANVRRCKVQFKIPGNEIPKERAHIINRCPGSHHNFFPRIPERCSIIQTGMNDFHTWACVAIFRPALFDYFPQFLGESKACSVLRFTRSTSLHDRPHDHSFSYEVVVWDAPAQYLA